MSNGNKLILGEETIRLKLFQPRPAPEPGTAFVLFRDGHPLITLWPGDRLTSGEVRWGNYKKMYKVNVSEQSFGISCTLPCEGDAFEFHVQATVFYSVKDPASIVKRNVTDGRQVLEPALISAMRTVSRRYSVEQSADAENAIKQQVAQGSTKFDEGLAVHRFSLQLSLEEDARLHIRRLKEIDRALIAEKKQSELEEQRDVLAQKRTKSQMEFYGPIIQGGQWQLLALQLSHNPGDVAEIARIIRTQHQVDWEKQLRILQVMLEGDAIEGFQLDELGRQTLNRLVTSTLGLESQTKALTDSEEDE